MSPRSCERDIEVARIRSADVPCPPRPVTPISETRRNGRCFGGSQWLCRISSTVSTGSSPSTRRRPASAHPTPSSFASSLSPGERPASSSRSVSSKCCATARAGARARRGVPGSTRMRPSTLEAIKIHGIKPADLKSAPRFPAILAKLKDFVGRLADRRPRLQERTRFPRLRVRPGQGDRLGRKRVPRGALHLHAGPVR